MCQSYSLDKLNAVSILLQFVAVVVVVTQLDIVIVARTVV
jgi:hypothetical protein